MGKVVKRKYYAIYGKSKRNRLKVDTRVSKGAADSVANKWRKQGVTRIRIETMH